MLDVTVMVTVCRPWRRCRCSGGARHGAQASADRRTDAGAVPAAGNRADYSPGARPEQSARKGALTRIVRVCRRCRCRQQSGDNYTANSRSFSHVLLFFICFSAPLKFFIRGVLDRTRPQSPPRDYAECAAQNEQLEVAVAPPAAMLHRRERRSR